MRDTTFDCPYCGGEDATMRWETFSNGTTHIRVECATCGKYLRWAKQTPENLLTVGPKP